MDGKLYIGGRFRNVEDMVANYVAMWDGSSWYAMGDGVNSEVYAISEWQGDACFGGGFTTAGGKTSLGIAVWSGGSAAP